MPMLALPPPDPGFELLISSHGTSQGLRLTDGAQLFPRVFIRLGDVQIGGQWRNISSPSANGVAAIFVKFGRKSGQCQMDAGLLYRMRTGAKQSANSRAWEFNGSGQCGFGRLGVRINADFSPKEFERGKSLYVAIGPSFEIDKLTRLSAGVGRRERDGAPDYTAVNAGISRAFDRFLTIDARFYDTSRSELGKPFRLRVVVSARLEF